MIALSTELAGIHPTRLELVRLRRRKVLADGIIDILNKDLEALMLTLFESLKEIRLLQSQVGEALNKALGSRKGIVRFGFSIVPMDCSLAIASLDLVKRPFYALNLKLKTKKIEDMIMEDILHFLQTFSNSLQANVHIMVQYGSNDHHKIEAAFKALALSLRKAISLDMKRRNFPSSKGVM